LNNSYFLLAAVQWWCDRNWV